MVAAYAYDVFGNESRLGLVTVLRPGGYANIVTDSLGNVVTDSSGNIVTGPAWPAHPQWMRQFLDLLGTKIEA